MTREEIDAIWQKAMHSAIKANEPSTRYEFANLILEKVAKVCKLGELYPVDADYAVYLRGMDEAIRSMKV